MRIHMHVAGVQEQGCGALVNLCADADNAAMAVGMGGIEAVLAAIKMRAPSPSFPHTSCSNQRPALSLRHSPSYPGIVSLRCPTPRQIILIII